MTTNLRSPGTNGQPVEDSVLIAAFVANFVQSQPLLLANANLRIEPTFDTLQLLSKKEGLLATAALAAQPLTATWPTSHRVPARHVPFWPRYATCNVYTFVYPSRPLCPAAQPSCIASLSSCAGQMVLRYAKLRRGNPVS
jgi:hypothetical protein